MTGCVISKNENLSTPVKEHDGPNSVSASVELVKDKNPEELKLLGIDTQFIFKANIPAGYCVTLWCERYEKGKLSRVSNFLYVFNNDKIDGIADDITAIFTRRNPDFYTGEYSTKGIWSFCFVNLPGELIHKDPYKICGNNVDKLFINNLSEIEEGKPYLLYKFLGSETNKDIYRSESKKEEIDKNDHAFYIFILSEKRYKSELNTSGMGKLDDKNNLIHISDSYNILTKK